MKLVKNFVLAVLLACVIAISAPAGELGTPGFTSEPAPSPTPQRATSTSDEEIVISFDTSDYLFFEALRDLLSIY